VMLAAQWVAAGFSADAAARWIRQGVHSPQPALPTTHHHNLLPPPSAKASSSDHIGSAIDG
jgi:hypothetical protein